MCRAAVQKNRTQSCMLTLKKLHADAKTADIRMVGGGAAPADSQGRWGSYPQRQWLNRPTFF